MTEQPSDHELREELRRLDDELTEMRQQVRELRGETSDEASAPLEREDMAATLTAAEEQEALIEALEGRRERLRAQLGEAG